MVVTAVTKGSRQGREFDAGGGAVGGVVRTAQKFRRTAIGDAFDASGP